MTRAPALALLLLLGCVNGAKIRGDADVVAADIDRARKSGAQRCAPTELATAEASLNFARGELSQGNGFRASQHITEAEDAVRRALALSRDCAPRDVVVAPQVVRIEQTDRDGDGVLDNDDKCPLVPGPASNHGCPDENADRDGDGVPDLRDRCPDTRGSAENAGCPDADRDGDGVVDRLDRCPDQPGPVKNEGCPVTDRDSDGVLDPDDKCPDVPGPRENAGCPITDRDGDGIPDPDDKCPDVPGPRENGGCPKVYTLVVVKKDRIEIKQQIKFKTGSAKIVGAESGQIIGEVAQAMKDNPQIKKIRVEGHTDSIGNDAANLRLSQNRADSVKSALIKEGVDPGRLESVGYGETRPISSNTTAVGRSENRRTEFNISDP